MNETSNWDAFFRIWALTGPLIAAAAVAWWTRRVNARETREEARRRYEELKVALAGFLASSQDYVLKQSIYLTEKSEEALTAASNASERFAYGSQLVTLIAEAQLADAAIELWNTTLEIPRSYSEPFDHVYTEKLVVYRALRAKFTELAREELQNLR